MKHDIDSHYRASEHASLFLLMKSIAVYVAKRILKVHSVCWLTIQQRIENHGLYLSVRLC